MTVTVGHHFEPDGHRARRLDRAMRGVLGDSLAYLARQSAAVVPVDEVSLNQRVAELHAGARHRPAMFADYAALVLALSDEDLAAAETLFAELAAMTPDPLPTRILALDAPELVPHVERYLNLMGADDAGRFAMAAPSPSAVPRFLRELDIARGWMHRAMPELAEEFAALVSQLILVRDASTGMRVFDGGSSYMLWGALFVNIERPRTPLGLLELLAHESAHLLLYAFARDETLVLNDDSELYPSPLRQDPRPMDGIFHATWVSARMHWAMERMLATDLLDAPGRAEAQAARDQDRENFFAGQEVVERHGRLTATGRELIDAARAYMT